MQSVCVFCGSNPGARHVYAEAARALGRMLAERGLRLVYGGAAVGLMGTLADAALATGGNVVGVIPGVLVAREIAHAGLTEIRVVDSMHERKSVMAELSDGFIALPGGAGTLEELFEVWTWSQLGLHRKPVGLLNVEGYFNALIAFLDHQTNERFMRREHRDMLLVDADPALLLKRFETYRPPRVEKWIRPSET
ncbi:MAG TPA: TIGR00730 family Rossman fold protein [Propylenella sp.]|nr:TIGR00730 family Rossman fold protein [Propylenella sp.]